jgi:hypothetical protein
MSATAIVAIQRTTRTATIRTNNRYFGATQIQRRYRGMRGRLIVAPLKAWRRWKLAITIVRICLKMLKRARFQVCMHL